MIKAFIISAFMTLGGAGMVFAQSPETLPTRPVPSNTTTREKGTQERAALKGEGGPSLPSGSQNCPVKSCDVDPCCAATKVCGPPGQFWVSGEYLLWWFKDARVPALVTTGPANPGQTPPPGALGAAGTGVLFGGQSLDGNPFSGMRFTAGFWLNEAQTYGVEASYFSLGSRSNNFATGSTGAADSQVLARPFFDLSTGMANSELIAFPGLASGTVGVQSTSRLQGAAANFLCNLCCSCPPCCDCCQPRGGYRVDVIGGLRYMNLGEGVGVSENTQVLPGSPVFPGSTIRAFDQFDTRNQFYGGQVGARAWWYRDRLFANVTGMVALGTTHQTVDVNGSTTITPPGGPATVVPAGLLAQPGNIGHFSRDRLSIIPEVGFNVGYRITNNLSAFAGYNFLYWSNVVRPGDQINLAVNSTRTPVSLLAPTGPAAPPFGFRGSDFWAQGVSVGLQLLF